MTLTRRVLLCLAVAPALLLGGCEDSPTEPEVLVIRGGTSFGFCLPTAYCTTTLEITSTTVVLTRTSRTLGDVRTTGSITPAEWESLTEAVDEGRLRPMPDVVGCPDCADGGAEFVEVVTADWTKRVTFEFGATLPPIQPLVDQVRAIRRRLEPSATP
jgi:hypothetical protein